MATIYTDEVTIDASSDRLLMTITSGDETFNFHLPRAVAIAFEQQVKRNAWPIHCAPDGELVPFKPQRRKGAAK